MCGRERGGHEDRQEERPASRHEGGAVPSNWIESRSSTESSFDRVNSKQKFGEMNHLNPPERKRAICKEPVGKAAFKFPQVKNFEVFVVFWIKSCINRLAQRVSFSRTPRRSERGWAIRPTASLPSTRHFDRVAHNWNKKIDLFLLFFCEFSSRNEIRVALFFRDGSLALRIDSYAELK